MESSVRRLFRDSNRPVTGLITDLEYNVDHQAYNVVLFRDNVDSFREEDQTKIALWLLDIVVKIRKLGVEAYGRMDAAA